MINTRRVLFDKGENPMERKFKSFYLKVAIMIVVVIFAQVRACSAATSLKLYSQHSVSSTQTGSMTPSRKLKKKKRFAFDRNCVPKRKITSRKRIGYNHFR